MQREILTYPILKAQVHDELAYFVEYFSDKGDQTCEVLFGFAWGNEYYPANEWLYEQVNLSHLIWKVDEVEKSGIGSLGRDDLFIKIAELEFRFCNDSDIHIYFEESNEDVEYYYARWKQLGYQPAEWIINQKDGPGERVRFN
jgi:hypothetical protein